MSTVDAHVLPTGTWQVDKVHSSIGFAVDYMAGTFHGTFSDFDAVVTDGVLNGSRLMQGVLVEVDVEVDAEVVQAPLDVGEHEVDAHRAEDLLLVVPRDRAQDVRAVVDALKARGRDDKL